MENLLQDFALNPELARKVMEIVADYSLAVNLRAVKARARIVVLGDDYAHKTAPFMSPQMFEEFILPYLRRGVEELHRVGAYVIKHSDGFVWPILDMIVDTGIDAFHSIDPSAGMDIGEVKEKYGHRVCLIGNIDCGNLLTFASPEEVREKVRETIEKAAPGGGYILSSSNSIHSGVKSENYLAMLEAAKKYGTYGKTI
jgi:uroporphyrinogen decarboxylase